MSKLTLQNKTWVPGDTFREAEIKPGLFVYSGFGLGHYFSVNGQIFWVDVESAVNMAKDDGVKFDYFDPLFSTPYLGDGRCDTK